jgi:triose/dihydroxyacetone kinase / FAD-AMP lyase (cyclizing)
MKKLINHPADVVSEMVDGLIALYPGLSRLADDNVVLRSDIDSVRNRQVALISGGGSGHEPAHAGYVGPGMLSAAVAGEVFTSPSADSVYAAIKAVAGKPGVLLIVKNYTGDRLNFGLAAEMARAEGINVEMVIVADDVATASMQENAGRRGIAGTVLVHKIAGAAAANGEPLAEVRRIAADAAQSVATMGLSLAPGIVPAIGKPNFILGDKEIELGLGIHGEPGVKRMPLDRSDALVDLLVESICALEQPKPGDRAVLLINNLGSTTGMELAIVARRALHVLQGRGVVIERSYAGTFMSSLETAGISLSLMPVDDARLKLLDAETQAPAWPHVQAQRSTAARVIPAFHRTSENPSYPSSQTPGGQALQRAIHAACRALITAEQELTRLDQAVGDGDLGISLRRGAEAIGSLLHSCNFDDASATLRAMSAGLQHSMGGSSGPLYGVLLLRAANALQEQQVNTPAAWAYAIAEGCRAIGELGGARLGDRTMLDALVPFEQKFSLSLENGDSWAAALRQAASAAEEGAKATARMMPRRGRSSYLGERSLGYADPGAEAVALWLRAVAEALDDREISS